MDARNDKSAICVFHSQYLTGAITGFTHSKNFVARLILRYGAFSRQKQFTCQPTVIHKLRKSFVPSSFRR